MLKSNANESLSKTLKKEKEKNVKKMKHKKTQMTPNQHLEMEGKARKLLRRDGAKN